jgi:hypothetical protein
VTSVTGDEAFYRIAAGATLAQRCRMSFAFLKWIREHSLRECVHDTAQGIVIPILGPDAAAPNHGTVGNVSGIERISSRPAGLLPLRRAPGDALAQRITALARFGRQVFLENKM